MKPVHLELAADTDTVILLTAGKLEARQWRLEPISKCSRCHQLCLTPVCAAATRQSLTDPPALVSQRGNHAWGSSYVSLCSPAGDISWQQPAREGSSGVALSSGFTSSRSPFTNGNGK